MNHPLSAITTLKNEETRSICGENPDGAKGGGGRTSSKLGPGRKGNAYRSLYQGKTHTLADIQGSPGEIRHIWMTVTDKTEQSPFVLRNLILRMYWDNEEFPSVEVPLGDFFCNGFGVKSTVYSIPISVLPHGGMNSYIPMPFKERALITIENQHPETIQHFFYQIDYALLPALPENTLFFHSQWRREALTEMKKDYTVVEGIQGAGHFFGMYMGMTPLERNWYGEGEIKMYIDGDKDFPTICGTGIEDYFGGAWGFVEEEGGPEMTYNSPYLGHPYLNNPGTCNGNGFNDNFLPSRGFYRWHIQDPVCFTTDLRITAQQIGLDQNGLYERQDDYCSVAYWYQTEPHNPFPEFPGIQLRRPR